MRAHYKNKSIYSGSFSGVSPETCYADLNMKHAELSLTHPEDRNKHRGEQGPDGGPDKKSGGDSENTTSLENEETYEEVRDRLIGRSDTKMWKALCIGAFGIILYYSYRRSWIITIGVLLLWLGKSWQHNYIKKLPSAFEDYLDYKKDYAWMSPAGLYAQICGIIVLVVGAILR